jgi:NAD(P)-dependent dehydrogenase (short-subunit alcohol dehydrogenase family)
VFDLSGRVALVTGAGRGVGRGVARALASQGAAVAVNDVYDDRAAETVALIAEAGGRAFAATFDVTDLEAVRAGIGAAVGALGPVDVLVNNAGIPFEGMATTPFRQMTPEQWRSYVDLNLYGVIHCASTVLDGMCERGFGRIVIISSGAAIQGLPIGITMYGAGKAGALGWMRHAALEVARDGVTINALALGLMDTVLDGRERDESVIGALSKGIPIGRLGSPADVGAACVWLASDEASWITGQTIGLDGGSTSRP